MPRDIVPKSPDKAPGYEKYLADTLSGTGKPSRSSTMETDINSPDSLMVSPVTVMLGPSFLRVKVNESTAQTKDWFTNWPYSKSPSTNLPTVIAYIDKQILWGFAAEGHPRQISNLRGLLEVEGRSNQEARKQLAMYSGGKDASQVIEDFLSCVLEYIGRQNLFDIKFGQYTFIIPSSWGERETGSYTKAITRVVPIESVTFCRGIEAGAFWMIRKLRAAARRSGRVAILSDEPNEPIIRASYFAKNGSTQVQQLPGSRVYSSTTGSSSAQFAERLFRPENLSSDPQGVTVATVQGPRARMAEILSNLNNIRIPVEVVSSEEAISSLDEGLGARAAYEQPDVQRLLMRSYGVLTRVKWDNEKHSDISQKWTDFKGELWCDNVIQWMAFKMNSATEYLIDITVIG